MCSPPYLVYVLFDNRDRFTFIHCSATVSHIHIYLSQRSWSSNLTKHNVVVCDPVTRQNYILAVFGRLLVPIGTHGELWVNCALLHLGVYSFNLQYTKHLFLAMADSVLINQSKTTPAHFYLPTSLL